MLTFVGMIDFLSHSDTDRIIQAALREDIGSGDHSTLATVPEGRVASARCLIKQPGILAGVAAAQRVVALVDPELAWHQHLDDGAEVQPGDIAFHLQGDPRSILQAERLLLNIMQRMSGIATTTREVIDLLAGTNCRLLDTRKTTPLFRHFEKWAVAIGGGVNHRFGLYDMIMIKDNHVDYAGSITAALESCRSYLTREGLTLAVEIETRSLDEVREALAVGVATRIMLDNMPPALMRKAVLLIDGQAETEASGGITLDQVPAIAATGVDFISMGMLTHSIKSLDISLKADS
jgi:nicotinate-nucleotide pyrophosphorylase (carboxylating)